MYKRYYDGYQRPAESKDRGEIIVPETLCDQKEAAPQIASNDCGEIAVTGKGCKNLGLPFSLELDDLILIGILLFLLFDKNDCQKDDDNDIFMLLIIGLIIFSDIF